MGRKAYTTVEAATSEAAQRFDPRGWRRIRLAFQSIRPELDSLNRSEAGTAKLASAAPALDRAAKQLRRAAAAVARAVEDWRLMSPEEVGVPLALLSLGKLASAVEQTAAQARAFTAGEHGTEHLGKQWLVKVAAKQGVRGRAADWCYAFIALGVDKPEQDAQQFQKRVSTFARDTKKAGLPVVR